MARKKTEKLAGRHPDSTHPCAIKGCKEPGEYKAPRSRKNLRDYMWLCLEHVRDYNKAWDYFDGMDSEQIEKFMKEAVTGHRPTWKTAGRVGHDTARLDEALSQFFEGFVPRGKTIPHRARNGKEQRAMNVFELDDRVSLPELKKRYKSLVKRYHPDLNAGDKESEERFKQVTVAYKFLMQSWA